MEDKLKVIEIIELMIKEHRQMQPQMLKLIPITLDNKTNMLIVLTIIHSWRRKKRSQVRIIEDNLIANNKLTIILGQTLIFS